jgi:hypothetical protein
MNFGSCASSRPSAFNPFRIGFSIVGESRVSRSTRVDLLGVAVSDRS